MHKKSKVYLDTFVTKIKVADLLGDFYTVSPK